MDTQCGTREDAERGLKALLSLCGDDPDRDGLADTPRRIIDAYTQICDRSCLPDPETLMGRVFDADGSADQMITIGPIEFTSVCEHHLFPFTGQAWIAYLPVGEKIVGLSKFARLVAYFAAGLQVQERMTRQIADAIVKYAPTEGCAVRTIAHHGCMGARGAKQPHAKMAACELRGPFRDNAQVRAEFLDFARP